MFFKIKKRIFTLLIPFLIWNTIYTLIILVGFNLPFLSGILNEEMVGKITVKKVLRGVFLAERSVHLWFVQSLIFFVTLTPLFFYVRKNKVVKYCVLGLLIIFNAVRNLGLTGGAIDIVNKVISFFGKYSMDIHNLVFFFVGVCLVDFEWFYNPKRQKKLVSFISLVLLIICALLSRGLRDKFVQIRFITLYPMIILAWLAGDLFISEKTIKIEKISFYIYCSHYLLQMILKRITYVVLGNNAF